MPPLGSRSRFPSCDGSRPRDGVRPHERPVPHLAVEGAVSVTRSPLEQPVKACSSRLASSWHGRTLRCETCVATRPRLRIRGSAARNKDARATCRRALHPLPRGTVVPVRVAWAPASACSCSTVSRRGEVRGRKSSRPGESPHLRTLPREARAPPSLSVRPSRGRRRPDRARLDLRCHEDRKESRAASCGAARTRLDSWANGEVSRGSGVKDALRLPTCKRAARAPPPRRPEHPGRRRVRGEVWKDPPHRWAASLAGARLQPPRVDRGPRHRAHREAERVRMGQGAWIRPVGSAHACDRSQA